MKIQVDKLFRQIILYPWGYHGGTIIIREIDADNGGWGVYPNFTTQGLMTTENWEIINRAMNKAESIRDMLNAWGSFSKGLEIITAMYGVEVIDQ